MKVMRSKFLNIIMIIELIELRIVLLENNGEWSWRGISASLVSINELTWIGVVKLEDE